MTTVTDDLLNELNDCWNQAEIQLRKYRVSYPVTLSLEEGGFLRFFKPMKDWRICYSRNGEEDTYTPIAECSVATRIEMAKHFPRLKQEVAKTTAETVLKIKEATTRLKTLISP